MLVKELAHKTGIPKKTIDKYMLTNGTMPPADKAVKIAQALGVTTEYLITGKKNTGQKMPERFLSPELLSIIDRVEPLSRENRKIVKNTVFELVKLIKHSSKDEPVVLTPLQKVFLRIFRK
jgi:transcriptional regulator with XRE-family HTH domain